jgi:hypothetical protein
MAILAQGKGKGKAADTKVGAIRTPTRRLTATNEAPVVRAYARLSASLEPPPPPPRLSDAAGLHPTDSSGSIPAPMTPRPDDLAAHERYRPPPPLFFFFSYLLHTCARKHALHSR